MFTSNPDCGRQKGYFRYTLGLAVWAALFCLLLWPGEVVAQTAATGALKGIVTDPSGSVISGATITINSLAMGHSRTATTQSNGSYLVPLLPPGWKGPPVVKVTVAYVVLRRG